MEDPSTVTVYVPIAKLTTYVSKRDKGCHITPDSIITIDSAVDDRTLLYLVRQLHSSILSNGKFRRESMAHLDDLSMVQDHESTNRNQCGLNR